MFELKTILTKDGSASLYSDYYREAFHSYEGALKEAHEKFLVPSQLEQINRLEGITILDVCLGLGYNTGCFLEVLLPQSLRIQWWGLEIDKRPLEIAVQNNYFRKSWSPNVLKIFDEIKQTGQWKMEKCQGEILWGDARRKLKEIPRDIKFDFILLDAFSPPKCPQLWSDEFLSNLVKRLSINGRLITYSRAASVRASLRNAGLTIRSIIPSHKKPSQWSAGTIAISNKENKVDDSNAIWKPLTEMEEDHLNTRAAIPYRDPTGCATAIEIHTNRHAEQLRSTMKSTSSWKKQWNTAKYQESQ